MAAAPTSLDLAPRAGREPRACVLPGNSLQEGLQGNPDSTRSLTLKGWSLLILGLAVTRVCDPPGGLRGGTTGQQCGRIPGKLLPARGSAGGGRRSTGQAAPSSRRAGTKLLQGSPSPEDPRHTASHKSIQTHGLPHPPAGQGSTFL